MKKLEYPIIILNFKNYSEATGEKALRLAIIAEEVSKNKKVNIAICPQTVDIRMISQEVDLPILAQHIDSNDSGSHTGNNLVDAIIEAGAIGTLVNHSERQLKISEIEKIIEKSKEKGFLTCVCANNIQTSKAVAALDPAMVAMEPPELIGGNVSVTTKPDLVRKTVESIKQINPNVIPLVGAGVKTKEDVEKAIKLGAKGVLLASGFVKSKDPKQALEEMADGILNS
ncbi:MAG: triose-phosphate isomerase [Candidatus Heimdallarchaeaceae archaeon]